MNDDLLLTELQNQIFILTLNRIDKHNAFDDHLLAILQHKLDEAISNPQVRIILLKANGRHFSAGADLNWMQRMAQFNEDENLRDAMVLARVMYTLNTSPKPTIAVVQGAAFGGGAGLAAACDVTIAASTARFCFSEVKLGLIPAVISPYVIKAVGERAAKWLFMTAETFDAEQAKQLGLVHYAVEENELSAFSLNCAEQMTRLAPLAVRDCKRLVDMVANKEINEELLNLTAALIAKKRVSAEGQQGLHAFLNKETPHWN
ncbi:enoyl-CoA hydratase-related protein [Legionella jamestowniensis]|uniref:Enoyl-CoA hydratase n=1 Tax=Legionella jamestowniensis TaxID=455 RepID=A0A0W0ULQ5_9GAMM|nr:enoyl-CoA hydratase-related protein [Legionella jamestowniensis]KTD08647.1 enoyl-CoA hydratase [Legionella jamestowniensis]OCH96907.1 gamma-carboxygeranoyl-CoA hydratase [Legionella jamestowniensis]SFL54167.1 methylglutaconyl-CoA hydratase [Legionella jamestowniensis DSM 19215]